MSRQDDTEFNIRILNCIDKVISSFGESPRSLLYYMIVNRCCLQKDDLPFKPLELSECLRKILGDAGGNLIEQLTITQIRSNFGITVRKGCSLAEAIEQARNRFLTC